MKILFVSLSSLDDICSQGIYSDLLSKFAEMGHSVKAMAPLERRKGGESFITSGSQIEVLHVPVGNITKTNFIEKGISTLLIGRNFQSAYMRYFLDYSPDLILFATPPTTLAPFVGRIKRKTGASTYLLLKDIFPQNSLDLEVLSKRGLKGLIYRWFKRSERKTYEVCDYIGCMSPANVKYLLSNEPWLEDATVEVAPNSFRPKEKRTLTLEEKVKVRKSLAASDFGPLFVYGGNLGKPQAIPYLIEVLKLNEVRPVGTFAIAGAGTERPSLEQYFESEHPEHAVLLPNMTPEDFDSLLLASDVGLILLDHKFTIPNFPSRLLSYLQASLPVLCATDKSTDVEMLFRRVSLGWPASTDPENLYALCCEVANMSREKLAQMGENARAYLEKNYTVDVTYNAIMRHFNDEK